MSNYKYPTPQLLLKAICDTIRAKTGSNDKIAHQDIPDELDSIIAKEEEYEIAVRELSNIIYGSEVKVLDSKYIPYIASYKFCGSGLTTIDLPKCTSIGWYAFDDCTNLTTIDLPECTSIEYGAFRGCNSLTTIDLPECTSIGDNAFRGCTNLTTIYLPECTSIESGAFNSTNLTTVILSNNQVATLGDIYAFNNSAISARVGYVYVPDDLVDSYKTATNWSACTDQIKPISELPSELKEEYNL